MTQPIPILTQFRIEPKANDLIHLIFDCPDRTMNVFSNKAIHELGTFAEWLHHHPARGVVVRSGKTSGFCAGADLAELGVAYDMIVSAPPADRFDMAFDHFFPLSHAIRRLETAGTPVVAAISGVALGGGCELALGCHHRVGTTAPGALLGLPECGVGLLPGAGGTQRMPRLLGAESGLEVLLHGRTLQGGDALAAGLLDSVVEPGAEIAAAEAWLLSDQAHSTQPWDKAGHRQPSHADYADLIETHRHRELARMLGHEPAPLAILDCVELGLMQPIDAAIRSEMAVFAHLIQRPEPRNMIRVMFQGKLAWDKARRDGGVTSAVAHAIAEVESAVASACENLPQLRSLGLMGSAGRADVVQLRVGGDYWFLTQPSLNAAVARLRKELAPIAARLAPGELLQLDHRLAVTQVVPAYLGSLTGLLGTG